MKQGIAVGSMLERHTIRGDVPIEEHHRCFGLNDYFMAAVLVAARYSRRGFSLCLAIHARRVRVPGGSVFHLEPGTIYHLQGN